jgi:hypothetical protein
MSTQNNTATHHLASGIYSLLHHLIHPYTLSYLMSAILQDEIPLYRIFVHRGRCSPTAVSLYWKKLSQCVGVTAVWAYNCKLHIFCNFNILIFERRQRGRLIPAVERWTFDPLCS